MKNFILLAAVLVNLITFAVYGIDKLKAVKGAWRIPERVLLLLAACGGGVGALLGMLVWHHKVRKPKFFIGVPAILLAEFIIFLFIRWQLSIH